MGPSPLILFVSVFLSTLTLIQGECSSCENLKIIGGPSEVSWPEVVHFGREKDGDFEEECKSLYFSKFAPEYLVDPSCLLKLDKEGALVAKAPNGTKIGGCTQGVLEITMPDESSKELAIYQNHETCVFNWTQPIGSSKLVAQLKEALCYIKLHHNQFKHDNCKERFSGLVHKDYECIVVKPGEEIPIFLNEKSKSYERGKSNLRATAVVLPKTNCKTQMRRLNRKKYKLLLKKGKSVNLKNLGFTGLLRKASNL